MADEPFFGWHLHLVCDAHGIPISFDLLPACWDELVPVQSLRVDLPAGSQVVADKGYISDPDQQLAYIVLFPNNGATWQATPLKMPV